MDAAKLRGRLAEAAPCLWNELSELARGWTAPILHKLNRMTGKGSPKSINDPVWGTIELYPWEVVRLDSPLLQRLRGVRQLGLAHYVYPGAVHDAFREALPTGLPATVHSRIKEAFPHLTSFLDMAAQSGLFAEKKNLLEKEFQERVRDHLRSRGVRTLEGAEFAGGETDLLLFNQIAVENKVAEDLADPLASGPHYAWQARRYSMAISQRVSFVLLAYRPRTEAAHTSPYQRIAVSVLDSSPDGHVQIRLAVRWGYSVPSHAKKPAPSVGPSTTDQG